MYIDGKYPEYKIGEKVILLDPAYMSGIGDISDNVVRNIGQMFKISKYSPYCDRIWVRNENAILRVHKNWIAKIPKFKKWKPFSQVFATTIENDLKLYCDYPECIRSTRVHLGEIKTIIRDAIKDAMKVT
jgi:hypothetical protein